MLIREARLIATAASLRAGGMRVRIRDVLAARRALAAAGSRPGAAYAALEAALRPSPREREVFDAVVLGGLRAERVLTPPPSRRRARPRRPGLGRPGLRRR